VGGFLHLSAGIEVLDLIAISVDVMLSLSYESDATYREAVTAVGRFRSARARP
jgi:hypothetical protein